MAGLVKGCGVIAAIGQAMETQPARYSQSSLFINAGRPAQSIMSTPLPR
jgi:hypothetical protein